MTPSQITCTVGARVGSPGHLYSRSTYQCKPEPQSGRCWSFARNSASRWRPYDHWKESAMRGPLAVELEGQGKPAADCLEAGREEALQVAASLFNEIKPQCHPGVMWPGRRH